jgi:sialic acid synthase SpsE
MMIGKRRVSAADPCFVIAEIGVNHNGDLDLARRLVDAAAAAGADAVKFQTFRTGDLVVKGAPKAAYQQRQTGMGSQAEMLSDLELSFADFENLRDHCVARSILFMSTAFESQSLADVLKLGPAALKWPSGEIDNVTLLRQAAASRLPIILSTGMAMVDEIATALSVLEAASAGEVAVLQCVSQYPAPMAEQNLRCIATLADRFACVTGFSDHTEGPWAAIAARPLGMAILEKHITLDRSMPGPDHAASMEPEPFARLIEALREVESALGDGVKRPTASELDTHSVARKSLVYARDLPAGQSLTSLDLVAKRPAGGISPAEVDSFTGKKLRRAVVADQPVTPSDVG